MLSQIKTQPIIDAERRSEDMDFTAQRYAIRLSLWKNRFLPLDAKDALISYCNCCPKNIRFTTPYHLQRHRHRISDIWRIIDSSKIHAREVAIKLAGNFEDISLHLAEGFDPLIRMGPRAEDRNNLRNNDLINNWNKTACPPAVFCLLLIPRISRIAYKIHSETDFIRYNTYTTNPDLRNVSHFIYTLLLRILQGRLIIAVSFGLIDFSTTTTIPKLFRSEVFIHSCFGFVFN